jgi:hypothetical protein
MAPPDVARQGNVKGHPGREDKATMAGTQTHRERKNSVPIPADISSIFSQAWSWESSIQLSKLELEELGGNKLLGDRNGHDQDHPSRTVIEDRIP